MNNSYRPLKTVYTEIEAAQALGISLTRLQMILDEHLFNDGGGRPPEVTFQASDLVVLGFWHKAMANPKVVRMPRRT